MIHIDAVLETYGATGFTAWPIAEPAGPLLALSGQMSPAEVGTAMAIIFDHGDIPTAPLDDLHHLMDRHLIDAEALTAPGGLRVTDTATRAELLPGCCCGLEDWREWRDVLHGEDIWLGHDPGTEFAFMGGAVRLRQGHEVEIRLDDLPALLDTVRLQLQGFLGLVGRWAGEIAPASAGRLVTVLDENFAINEPLDLT
ncbi:hypothetical protein SAMN05444920_11931 [Nonomuraea solani]|uniref:Uncharacterized protein n=1 Tax=Nonomuraea solani TaxID=1144553 RepID=A0A1H6EVI8_9ACTN|nr:hypothetical protein [Nonomuraea solani]SEH01101.1 hypothetical protein SAMN05444920_11931 [Nonomuraea solani]